MSRFTFAGHSSGSTVGSLLWPDLVKRISNQHDADQLKEVGEIISAFGTIGVESAMHQIRTLIQPRTKEVLTNRSLTGNTLVFSYLFSSRNYTPEFVFPATDIGRDVIMEESCKFLATKSKNAMNPKSTLKHLLQTSIIDGRPLSEGLKQEGLHGAFSNICKCILGYPTIPTLPSRELLLVSIVSNTKRRNAVVGTKKSDIMNCVWKGMSGAWFMDDRQFTLDYVCIDREGLACVVEAVIMDEVDGVYSDHDAVSVSIEWKIKKKTKGKKRKCVSKKKSLDGSLCNEFADRMCGRVHTDLVSLSTSMLEVGEELKVVLERWTENRRG